MLRVFSQSPGWRQSATGAFSLLEMLLVLVVIAGLSLAAVRYFVFARQGAEITSAMRQINNITEASNRWLAGQRQIDYCDGDNQGNNCRNSISIEKLIAGGFVTEREVQAPWGSKSALGVSPLVGYPQYLGVGYSNLPVWACKQLVEKLKDKAVLVDGKPRIGCNTATNPAQPTQFYIGLN